uniref:Telomere length regulation protein TEL2 homolog n=1 Tax=Gouania willdenowi TaxID=441366 RepID=A0A8C5EFV4_GOUWI
MESVSDSDSVRLEVSACLRCLSSSDSSRNITVLQTLLSYLDEASHGAAQRAQFSRSHYSRTLRVLITTIEADWVHRLTARQREELWDALFLRGPPEQALLVLLEAIGELSPSTSLDHVVTITEKFLQDGRLTNLLWSYCVGSAQSDSPQLRETLLGRLSALPDIMANKLHHNISPLFLPQQYYPLLASAMLTALQRTCQALRDNINCSLAFVSQTLGKLCLQGHGLVLAAMAPRLSACTRSDMVWQRVCWKLFESIPQRSMECVLTALVPESLGRIVGNLVLRNKKAEFVITHKLLLLQYKYETGVLRTVLGYLAADRDRRPLLIQVLRCICQAWANPSAVKHTPMEQQLYVSKALLLSVSLLKDQELQDLRSELLQCLLGGMQSHLDSSVLRIRCVGMVVGECLSSRMDNADTKLKFEYEQDEETRELLSLMTPSGWCEPEPVDGKAHKNPLNQVSVLQHNIILTFIHKSSDDELTPYDMTEDQEVSQTSPPRYLRDCLESLMSSEDAMRVELSLKAADPLVRRNAFAAREISVQMSKVLLHMEDKYNIQGFLILRHAAMVALAVTDCIPVTQYLTTEFYSLNYSLRQRLDMLEVLVAAAQELSLPTTDKKNSSIISALDVAELPPFQGHDPVHWRQVVEKRIQSKTRRISKGASQPATAKATPNRYAPVAGYFFFPLLKNYDKPEVTFDLLGSDHLVLGRLIHSLGLFMHLAVNAPVVSPIMGSALLDFVWTVRYHTDQMVRRGVLFAVCSVFLSMPSQNLLLDLGDMLFETRTWLTDVAEGDPDADCRSLAVQSLVLLDKSLKKQLKDPQSPSLES